MYFSNLQQAVSGGQRAKQQKGQSAYSSQYNSSKRKQNDTSCTVLNGTSNNEVLDENFISSFLHLQATSNKVANQSKEQSAEKQQQAIRSVDVSRRSQSGEGNKVLQNDGLNSKHQSLMKNSNASKKIKNSFQNFLANQQDLDFLTKTIGCAPSVPITATKSFHNVNKSGEQHHSSSGVKATGKL